MHSLEHGFRTVLIEDACQGVALEDIDAMRKKLAKQGARIVNSPDVSTTFIYIGNMFKLHLTNPYYSFRRFWIEMFNFH